MLARVISGGQSGADRAALDSAIAAGIPYGGWCPRGGWAEDRETPPGIRADYPDLRETPSAETSQRTTWNVRDSDATLLLTRDHPHLRSPGTDLTARAASRLGRPHLVVDVSDRAGCEPIRGLIRSLPEGGTLNVGGPRESEAPGIYDQAVALLGSALEAPRG